MESSRMEDMIEWTLSVGSMGRSLCRPGKGTPPDVSRHRGFSIIELMMSLVLLGIGAALALPS